jgi:uncharacterized membrane protein YeaQ/YmgE (transglycosylase-associated protein family)
MKDNFLIIKVIAGLQVFATGILGYITSSLADFLLTINISVASDVLTLFIKAIIGAITIYHSWFIMRAATKKVIAPLIALQVKPMDNATKDMAGQAGVKNDELNK